MYKKIIFILITVVLLITGIICGFFIGEEKGLTAQQVDYEMLYKNLDKMSVEEKTSLYHSTLKAENSPTQVRYVLEKILPDVKDETVKNNMLALYLNHIQYYLSTYSNFTTIYQSIILNSKNVINYEEASASNKINDRVLKTLIEEIYNSDMKIVMPPPLTTNETPYLLVDYDKIIERYGTFMNDTTKDYIAFKEIAQNGGLSNPDGSYNTTRIGEYLISANNFITKYSNYPLISDVIYSYILGSKMYLGTYNMSEDFMPSPELIKEYKVFIEKYPDTPITNALKQIIQNYDEGKMITMEQANTWNSQLDSLIGPK